MPSGEAPQRPRSWQLVAEHALERPGERVRVLGRYEDAATTAERRREAVDVRPDHRDALGEPDDRRLRGGLVA